ncbi:uncharacterized protein [Littorina saxatilis]|uniref:uncharacterized protein n=1 Tax=Littorina saxatilis TaxID=31220 RepID=UPI0038B4D8EC
MGRKLLCHTVWAFILNLFVLIAGQAAVKLTFSQPKVTLTGSAAFPVILRCEVNGTDVKEIRVTHGETKKLVAVSQKDVSEGSAQVDPKYVVKKLTGSAGKDLEYLQLRFPAVLCEDNGLYTCTVRDKAGKVSNHTATLVVKDGIQKAKLIVTPDKSVKNVSEGEKVKFRCQQVYGVINPLDPRTRPRRIYWRWDYNKDGAGWVKINGALSIFENIVEPTQCDVDRALV